MPHVNIWIRKEDYEVWQRIKDKPGFLRASIRTFTLDDGLELADTILKAKKKYNFPRQTLGVLEAIPQVQALKFCNHGYDPKLCRFAKNGKPCK